MKNKNFKKGGKMTEKKEEKTNTKPYQNKTWLQKNYPKRSAGQLAREQNVSRSVILYYLRKNGIKITTRVNPKTGPAHLVKDANRSYRKKKWLEEQLKSGLSMYKISIICKVGFGNIKHYCEKFKLMALVEAQRAKVKKK